MSSYPPAEESLDDINTAIQNINTKLDSATSAISQFFGGLGDGHTASDLAAKFGKYALMGGVGLLGLIVFLFLLRLRDSQNLASISRKGRRILRVMNSGAAASLLPPMPPIDSGLHFPVPT